MSNRILVSVFAAAFAATASPVLADDYPATVTERPDAVLLEPASNWNIDFADNRCRLSRLFGSAEEPHLLFFEQAAPRSTFGVTLAGPALDRLKKTRRLKFGMERDKPMEDLEIFSHGNVEQVGSAVIIGNHSIGERDERERGEQALASAGIDLAVAETVDRIVLKKGKRVISFETGSMMPPFQALNVCTSDLLREWGLDPEQHKSYVPPSWENSKKIVRRIQEAYPREALNSREQGIFRMRVIVEEDGSVSNCHLEKSTVTDKLESPACKEMRSAKFMPARDADGKPMRSFYATTITYALN